VQTLVERERQEALAVRDPIAIALAAERFNTLAIILADLPAQEAVDLYRPLLTVSQTAKMLGYNAKEVRRLLGQGKIAGRKVGNEWRIPLWAVL
jgi:excisionase family DNA binding protein